MTGTGPEIQLLRRRIRAWVEARFDLAACRSAVLDLLGRRGYALHADAPCRAGVLSLESYRAASGKLDEAGLMAAAAVELHMDAAFAMDDIVDAPGPPEPGSVAVALQLLACGYALACEATRAAGRGDAGFAALAEFHRSWSVACDGFFLDAHLKRQAAWTLDDALDMTTRKSGGLGRFAAAFGAGLGAGDPGLASRFGDVGESIFTYRQLVDDLRDAFSAPDGDSDFRQGKRTLPLVYFHNYLGDNDIDLGGGTLHAGGAELALAYESSGAPLYGAIVAETFLNRAKATLAALGAEDLAVRDIERLVATIEAGSCDTVPA